MQHYLELINSQYAFLSILAIYMFVYKLVYKSLLDPVILINIIDLYFKS